MAQSKLLILFALLMGIGIGAWVNDSISASTATPPVWDDTPLIESVTPSAAEPQIVVERSDEASNLAQENLELRNQIAKLNQQILELEEQPQLVADSDVAEKRRLQLARRGAGGLTVEALTEAGISESIATNLKSRLDDIALQRLYLRDQARREGWLGKEQYRDQIRALTEAQNNLQSEYGERVYSRYLYAVGRPNQVTIQSVIENSPAFNAGLQAGDRVLAYGESNVFSPSDVRRGTQTGQAEELVPVQIERDGMRLDIYIPRGPMGVQMSSDSIRPPDD